MLLSPAFPAALHEAGRSAAKEAPGKYATDQIQLRGQAGQVVATDGRQALTRGGFVFPFADDLLVPAVPLFGSKELAREAGVSIGRTGDWLFLVVGPWRVWLRTDRAARFPDVAAVTPRAVANRVTFDDADAGRLLAALPRLPGKDEDLRPVTVDLAAGRVAVRSRDEETKEVTEVRLPDSTSSGPAVRLVLNRQHVGRALALGCRELAVADPGKPVVFRGPDTTFLTVPLDPAAAVPPAGAERETRALALPSPEPDRRIPVPTRDRPSPDRNGHTAHADGPPDHNGHAADAQENPDPLAEAEGLKAALAEAAARAARLVAALKSYRRERRSLQKLASQYLSLHR
jgi:hypothetical protein